MRTELLNQNPMTPFPESIGNIVGTRIQENKFDLAMVAVAYMTIAGIRQLLAAFSAHTLSQSHWLIGLDDYITQPGALDLVLKIPNSNVKVVSYASKGLRFHPKVYLFGRASSSKEMMIIGSTNLTAHGLAGNGEANAILTSERPSDTRGLNLSWRQLWAQGHSPTKRELIKYKTEYESAREFRRKMTSVPQAKPVNSVQGAAKHILSSDEAEIDPGLAEKCWIECGNVTAKGREIEIKSEQGLFFGLNPSGEDPCVPI